MNYQTIGLYAAESREASNINGNDILWGDQTDDDLKGSARPAPTSLAQSFAPKSLQRLGNQLFVQIGKDAGLTSIREQAAQAVRLANDIVLAARNAMEDANAAAQLMMTTPIRSFNELLQTLGKDFSGDVLYQKVIAKAKELVSQLSGVARTVTEAGGCFAAGTLVHTKDGLKPIELIQVGDWVLSKPESGEGEQAYKRVVNTFSFEDKQVMRITYGLLRDGKFHGDKLIVTPNHPFWVAGFDRAVFPEDEYGPGWGDIRVGWTRADKLIYGSLIELPGGELVRVNSGELDRLWKTSDPAVAWEAEITGETGYLVSIHNSLDVPGQLHSDINRDFNDDDTFVDRSQNPEWAEKWCYRTKVYNFEVEDFHTYYVGNLGAWVHNTNCYGTTVAYLKKKGVLPSIDGQNDRGARLKLKEYRYK